MYQGGTLPVVDGAPNRKPVNPNPTNPETEPAGIGHGLLLEVADCTFGKGAVPDAV